MDTHVWWYIYRLWTNVKWFQSYMKYHTYIQSVKHNNSDNEDCLNYGDTSKRKVIPIIVVYMHIYMQLCTCRLNSNWTYLYLVWCMSHIPLPILSLHLRGLCVRLINSLHLGIFEETMTINGFWETVNRVRLGWIFKIMMWVGSAVPVIFFSNKFVVYMTCKCVIRPQWVKQWRRINVHIYV